MALKRVLSLGKELGGKSYKKSLDRRDKKNASLLGEA